VKTALGAVIGGAVAGPLGAAAGAVITALKSRKPTRPKIEGADPVIELPPGRKPAKSTARRKPAARPRRRSAVDIYPPIP
jgi:hypothetical protein